MEGFRLLHKLRLTNLLSYGPEGVEIELQPLNVLIGPNGSGKSNFIDAISLLKASPSDISAPIRTGGGMPQWLWKGEQKRSEFWVEATLVQVRWQGRGFGFRELRHGFHLCAVGQDLRLVAEIIDDTEQNPSPERGRRPYFQYQAGTINLLALFPGDPTKLEPTVVLQGQSTDLAYSPSQSILSQLRDPVQYPEITYVGQAYSQIALFRECGLGPSSLLRGPQRADEPASFLHSDGRNLSIVLNDLLNRPATKRKLLSELTRFYDGVEDITTKVYANTIETSFHERGFTEPTPSIRLSDGTLRYLCLLAILCHPEPPPLVCIEDPEIGLHPDILPHLADLLVQASERMQLIVTTHSDILVDALTEHPEAVVVCERDAAGTHLERLDRQRLEAWLENYTLGGLWRMGELGGNP